MKPSVFISYRRRDSVAHVHALHGRLAAALGSEHVFMDVDDIGLGTDFMHAIQHALDGCELLIAVIGPGWAGGETTGERRIDRPDDVVRLEIAEALRGGLKVVPLFVGGVEAASPETLPEDLRGLEQRQGFSVRDDRFADDMELFVQRICRELSVARQPADTRAPAGARVGRETPPFGLDLARLATAVRRHWIDGVLRPGLGAPGMVQLGLRRRADLIPNPFADLVNMPPAENPADAPLDVPGESVLDLFEASGCRLVIVGDAGSGKTTSLLDLAEQLLDAHALSPTEPLPVVLHLGSWRPGAGDFSTWLITELNRRYRVPLDRARAWLDEGRLLPLLDGLDELPLALQAPCVDLIQAWGHAHSIPGYALCCRRADYERLPTRLGVGLVAEILPMQAQQLRELWRRRGLRGTVLDKLLTDSDALALGRTPLMAKMAAAARGTGPFSENREPPSATDLLNAYVSELFRRAPPTRGALEPGQVLPELGWIAARLSDLGQSEFQIEALDAQWLMRGTHRWLFGLTFGVLVGVVAGTVLGLYWWTITPNVDLRELGCQAPVSSAGTCMAMWRMQPLWTVAGGLWGLVLILIDPLLPKPPPAPAHRALATAGTALVAALYFLLWIMLWWALSELLGQRMVLGPIWLSGFSLAVLIAAWRAQRPGLTGAAVTVEAIAWDSPKALRGLLLGLPVGLGLWAINALLLGEPIPEFLPVYLLVALPVAAMLGGLKGRRLPRKIHANEGIRLSARNAGAALLLFAIAGALAGTGVGLLIWEAMQGRIDATPPSAGATRSAFVLRYTLAMGMALGTIAALWFGGAEVIKHWVLRLIAAMHTPLPLRLTSLLDRACALGLMQRVGGGYQFAHRLIGEHIARRWAPARH
jgi:hypothetical protein